MKENDKELYEQAEESVRTYYRSLRGIKALRAKIRLLKSHQATIKADISRIEKAKAQNLKDKYKEKAVMAIKSLEAENIEKDKDISIVKAEIEVIKSGNMLVSDIVKSLDKEKQDFLRLRYWEGLSYRLIGLEMGTTEWKAIGQVEPTIKMVMNKTSKLDKELRALPACQAPASGGETR